MSTRRLVMLVAAAAAVLALAPGPSASAGSPAWCSGASSWARARAAVGQPFRVKATVVRTYFASSTNDSPTFIDLGHAYPDSRRLTILIWGRDRKNFPRAPERMFRPGTAICAQGVIELYRGVPELEV